MNEPDIQRPEDGQVEVPQSHDESAPVTNDTANESPVDEVAALTQERDELKDRLYRTHAELDNFRKRTQRERDEERRYAVLPMAREILPVVDNLQRAIDAAAKGGSIEDLRQGVDMVRAQVLEVLARFHVEPIAAVGEPFDPNVHEAMTQVPSSDHPPMTVLEEIETGYRLHDRVVRPSKVIVAMAPPQEG